MTYRTNDVTVQCYMYIGGCIPIIGQYWWVGLWTALWMWCYYSAAIFVGTLFCGLCESYSIENT